MNYPSYSIAIRTLGTAGDKFRHELESIKAQTVQPERVLVYIAEGYPRPDYTIGLEEYVWVKKGMVAQRALNYYEIESECILMLDDDVALAPDSAEKLLTAMKENNADCEGADVFQNHLMPFKSKVYAALTNLVFPHRSEKWAFKIHKNGSFSYNNFPHKSFYWSQSCGGPAILWKKEVLQKIHLDNELWMDSLGFAYGDDMLESYKLYCNGGHLGVLYDSGITYLDAQSFSSGFRNGKKHIYIRTEASFLIWYRSIYRTGKDTPVTRLLAAAAFQIKTCLLAVPMLIAGRLGAYARGLRDGWRVAHSPEFRNLPPYIS